MIMDRDSLINFFEAPKTIGAIIYVVASILIVYLSLVVLAYEQKFWPLSNSEIFYIAFLENIVLLFFSLDFFARIVILRERKRYLTSSEGIIDLIAVAPALFSLIFPIIPNTEWFRAFRLFRFFRILKLFQITSSKSLTLGLFAKLIPWLGIALAIKLAVVIIFESRVPWLSDGTLDIPISVIGFATAILLGGKITIALTRFYSVEDSICRLVGALNGLYSVQGLRSTVMQFASSTLNELQFKKPVTNQSTLIYKRLARESYELMYDDSVICDLSKDHQHILHLVNSRTPLPLEYFIKSSVALFVFIAVIAVPSFAGIITTLLMVSIIGGMYILIDDLDEPIANNDQSLINIDISPLEKFVNHNTSTQPLKDNLDY